MSKKSEKYPKDKLYQQGKDSFPMWSIILQNIGFILNWGIGFVIWDGVFKSSKIFDKT